MEDIEITNRVKLARIEKDLTQEQLAELVGVTLPETREAPLSLSALYGHIQF